MRETENDTERATNDTRRISIVLMRKINCQNKLYFPKCVPPFVLDWNINQRLPLQTVQSQLFYNRKQHKKNRKLPAHTATMRNWGIMERRDWIQTLWGPWADNNLPYLHMQNPQVSLAGNLLGTAYFPPDKLSENIHAGRFRNSDMEESHCVSLQTVPLYKRNTLLLLSLLCVAEPWLNYKCEDRVPWRFDTQSNYRMHKQTSVMTEMPFFHTAGFPSRFWWCFFLPSYLQAHHML